MIPSPACIQLVQQFEGLRCSAYSDPVGIPTIGYGHTKNVSLGQSCTPEEADEWLIEDLAETAERLELWLPAGTVNQCQFDALCSITYNVGPGCPDGLGSGRDGIIWLAVRDTDAMPRHSTLLRLTIAGQFAGAAEEFMKWNHANGDVLAGLTRRRAAERELFRTGFLTT